MRCSCLHHLRGRRWRGPQWLTESLARKNREAGQRARHHCSFGLSALPKKKAQASVPFRLPFVTRDRLLAASHEPLRPDILRFVRLLSLGGRNHSGIPSVPRERVTARRAPGHGCLTSGEWLLISRELRKPTAN